jgi:hypothetical protein
MLVLLEGHHEVAEHRLEIRHELLARVLLKRREGGATGLLHPLVVVKDHAEKLRDGQSGFTTQKS